MSLISSKMVYCCDSQHFLVRLPFFLLWYNLIVSIQGFAVMWLSMMSYPFIFYYMHETYLQLPSVSTPLALKTVCPHIIAECHTQLKMIWCCDSQISLVRLPFYTVYQNIIWKVVSNIVLLTKCLSIFLTMFQKLIRNFQVCLILQFSTMCGQCAQYFISTWLTQGFWNIIADPFSSQYVSSVFPFKTRLSLVDD